MLLSRCSRISEQLRRFISEETAILIYKQTIRPLLEYCNFIFDSGKKLKLDKIDKIQSKCLRIIENCYSRAFRLEENM